MRIVTRRASHEVRHSPPGIGGLRRGMSPCHNPAAGGAASVHFFQEKKHG